MNTNIAVISAKASSISAEHALLAQHAVLRDPLDTDKPLYLKPACEHLGISYTKCLNLLKAKGYLKNGPMRTQKAEPYFRNTPHTRQRSPDLPQERYNKIAVTEQGYNLITTLFSEE